MKEVFTNALTGKDEELNIEYSVLVGDKILCKKCSRHLYTATKNIYPHQSVASPDFVCSSGEEFKFKYKMKCPHCKEPYTTIDLSNKITY